MEKNTSCCLFSPMNWGDDPIRLIFLNWLVQPPTKSTTIGLWGAFGGHHIFGSGPISPTNTYKPLVRVLKKTSPNKITPKIPPVKLLCVVSLSCDPISHNETRVSWCSLRSFSKIFSKFSARACDAEEKHLVMLAPVEDGWNTVDGRNPAPPGMVKTL